LVWLATLAAENEDGAAERVNFDVNVRIPPFPLAFEAVT
jgi:hypothetical protein